MNTDRVIELSYRLRNLLVVLALLSIVVYGAVYVYNLMEDSFSVGTEFPVYRVKRVGHGDTLYVAIIGDSWAEYHASLECDTIFQKAAATLTQKPVICISRGHGGKMTKEIYQEMFSDRTVEHEWEKDFCTQPLLAQCPQYCVVMGGINDLCWQRPLSYFTGNYQKILRLLLANHIRPVVMEMPEFDLGKADEDRGWQKYFYIRMVSRFTDAGWVDDGVMNYRQALRTMLQQTGLADSVLYIPADKWNTGGVWEMPHLYLSDRLHLNMDGYHALDSCMATEILNDYWKKQNK